MRKIISTFGVIGAIAVLSSSNSVADVLPDYEYTHIPFSVIEVGSIDYVKAPDTPQNGLIQEFHDQAALETMLNKYSETPVSPNIDFANHTIVLVAYGMVNNGGTDIQVEKVEDRGTYAKVFVVINKAGRDCIVTQSFTHPHQAVEIESKLTPIFSERVVVNDCSP